MSAASAPRREYVATLALLAAGGTLGLLASSRSWGTARLPSSLSVTSITVSGSDLLPFAPAVALVAIAAVVAVPAVRRIGRRAVGGVLALLGGALAVTAELAVLDLGDRVESWVTAAPGTSGEVVPGAGADQLTVSTSAGWGYAAAAAGVMVLVAGVMIAVRGPSWPAMGARYERRSGADVGRPGMRPGTDDDTDAASARETWDALDRGDDPT